MSKIFKTEQELILEQKIISSLLEYSLWTHNKNIKNENDILNNFISIQEKKLNIKFDNIMKGYLINKIESLRTNGEISQARAIRDFLFTSVTLKGENDKEVTLSLIDWNHPENNIYEIVDQVWFNNEHGTIEKSNYKNRKDLFLLINGIPMVSIEEKKADISTISAFNQTIDYRDIWNKTQTILKCVQLYIVTNGPTTFMFGNNQNLSYDSFKTKQVFCWANKNNVRMNDMHKVCESILEPFTLTNYISNYVKFSHDNFLYAKPHQFHAAESAISHFEKNWNSPGYIWHATGSGKTLTMYIVWENFVKRLEAEKTIVVVDRLDLDSQTSRNFSQWEQGIGTKGEKLTINSSTQLLKALKNPNKGKIITTIQKLNDLLTNNNNYDRTKEIEFLKQSKVAIIFDECHRSLFGEQFKKIKEFFNNAALLGFTGTPIFKSNSIDFNNVTNALFPTELHTYGLSQALKDNVILPIDYETPDIKAKDEQGNINDFSKNELYIIQKTKKYYDELVESVANKLSEKTMHGSFYAMLALSSIDALAYVANRLRETHPNIVFSADFSSISETFLEDSVNEKFVHKVDYKTEKTKVITDFRNNFGIEVDNEEDFTFNLIDMLKTNPVEYSKKKKLQLVLVVDKMLTGFDSEWVNTLFLDKPLKSYALIQAVARATRVSSILAKKSGFLVAYRTSQEQILEACKEYSGEMGTVKQTEFASNYQNRMDEAKELIKNIKKLAPTPEVIELATFSIEDKKELIKNMSRLINVVDILEKYEEFETGSLNIENKEYGEYISKYIQVKDEIMEFFTESEGNNLDISITDELIFTVTYKGIIDATRIYELVREVRSQDDWQSKAKPTIMQIIASTVLSSFDDKIINFIEDQLQVANWKIDNLGAFKSNLKHFLSEDLVRDFPGLIAEISKLGVEIDISIIKQFYGAYLQDPHDSTLINKLTNYFGYETTRKIYKVVTTTFEDFRKKDIEVKEIIEQVSSEI